MSLPSRLERPPREAPLEPKGVCGRSNAGTSKYEWKHRTADESKSKTDGQCHKFDKGRNDQGSNTKRVSSDKNGGLLCRAIAQCERAGNSKKSNEETTQRRSQNNSKMGSRNSGIMISFCIIDDSYPQFINSLTTASPTLAKAAKQS
jgi:hypothetical protein